MTRWQWECIDTAVQGLLYIIVGLALGLHGFGPWLMLAALYVAGGVMADIGRKVTK